MEQCLGGGGNIFIRCQTTIFDDGMESPRGELVLPPYTNPKSFAVHLVPVDRIGCIVCGRGLDPPAKCTNGSRAPSGLGSARVIDRVNDVKTHRVSPSGLPPSRDFALVVRRHAMW